MKMFVDIEKVYETNKQLKKEDVRLLAQFLAEQPHLPKLNEFQLIYFLHSCYYSIELAKNTIDANYTIKLHFPEVFSKRCPKSPEQVATQGSGLYSVLPKSTPEGYKILYCRLTDADLNKYVFDEHIKLLDMQYTLWLNQTHHLPDGFVLLADLKGISFGFMSKFSINTMKRYAYYLQEAMPIRMKGFHFINIVPFMDTFMALVKPLLGKQLKDSLYVHNKVEDVYRYIPKECLPTDYGGEAGTILELQEKQNEDQRKNEHFFEEEALQVVDESKRPKDIKIINDVFGLDGTFKKLEID